MGVQKKNLLISLIMICILSGFAYWNFKNWKKPLANPQKIELPKIDLIPLKEGYADFASPDGKLKLKYPAGWFTIDAKTLESYSQERSEGTPLLLVEGFRMDAGNITVAFLTVQELNTEGKKSTDEIVAALINKVRENNREIEILNLETNGAETIFESKRWKKDGPVFLSREKLIIGEKIYLVSFFTFDKDWPKFDKERNEIINSVQIVQ